MSSKWPPRWLIVNEFGKWTGPGPFNDTCGPVEPPLIGTVIGQPGTDILLNDTLIMWSQASAGTNETVNLCQKNNFIIYMYDATRETRIEREGEMPWNILKTYLALPCGWTCVGILWPLADIVISKFPSPASPASTVNWTFRPTVPLLTDPTATLVASYDFATKGVPYCIQKKQMKNKIQICSKCIIMLIKI